VEHPIYRAFEYFKAGQLAEAEDVCNAILVRTPNDGATNHLLGMIWFRQGKTVAARDLLARLSASPGATPEVHNNYGLVLKAVGENDAAIVAFKRALALDPELSDATINFKRACREIVPAWHFAMMADKPRNDAYQAAIERAVLGRRVLDIGTGAGLLAMMAARAGADSVISCEMVGVIAERARDIIALNGLSGRITVIDKASSELAVGRGLPERAQVLVTEVFSSSLIREGVLPTIEHAHQQLLTDDAIVIPQAASAMGYLIGGPVIEGMLFAGCSNGFDLSQFDDFAPSSMYAALDGVPHKVLSDDAELLRFDLRAKFFPIARQQVAVAATHAGNCAGVAQWIRLELDENTCYENRPAPNSAAQPRQTSEPALHYPCGWTHVLYRFPKLIRVEPGDIVKFAVTHDRRHFTIDLTA
jgi:hypothetical protein